MRRQRQAGQSIAELAFLLPLLMLILMGCVDLGRAFGVWMNLANVAREGARYASIHCNVDRFTLKSELQFEIEAEGLDYASVEVNKTIPSTAKPGQPVQVSAEYHMPLLTGFLFGGRPVRIRAMTEMVIISEG